MNSQAPALQTRLLNACETGSLDLVKSLINEGGEVYLHNAMDEQLGYLPIHRAVKGGNLDTVRFLIQEKNVKVDAPSRTGGTPAMYSGFYNQLSILQFFVEEKGVDVNYARPAGITILIFAAQEGSLDCLNYLIEHGADVDKAHQDGRTPLWQASQKGHLEIVKALIGAQANLDKPKDTGSTPLFIASQNGHLAIVEVLISAKADINQGDNEGCTPLWIASQEGHLEIGKALIGAQANLDKPRDTGSTPLFIASHKGHFAIVEVLISAKANVDAAREEDNSTPLIIAAYENQLNVVKALCSAGANISLKDTDKKTACAWAKERGYSDIVNYLEQELARREKSDEQKSDLKASIESPAVSPEIPVRSTSAPAPEQDLLSFLESLKLSKHFDFFVDSFGMECVEDFALLEQGHWTQIQETLLHIPAKKLTKKLFDKGIINTSVFDPQTRQSDQGTDDNRKVQTSQGMAEAMSVFLMYFTFLAFLSHFKEESGTEARLLKLKLVQYFIATGFPITQEHVFLDSDDLYDLSQLLRSVQQTKYLIVLLTLRVLTRPWCLLEIVTAYKTGVEFVPVKMLVPQAKQFDLQLFTLYKTNLRAAITQTLVRAHGNTYTEAAEGEADSCIQTIQENGFTIEEVQAAICRLSEKIAKDLNPLADDGVIDAQVKSIVKQMKLEKDS